MPWGLSLVCRGEETCPGDKPPRPRCLLQEQGTGLGCRVLATLPRDWVPHRVSGMVLALPGLQDPSKATPGCHHPGVTLGEESAVAAADSSPLRFFFFLLSSGY